jgi:alpha-N-arabinofuranosidase
MDRPWKVADMGPFGVLDVTATCDTAGRELCVAVVNRSLDQAIATTLQLDGRALRGALTAFEVNGADVCARNSFEEPNVIDVRTRQAQVNGVSGPVEYTFPAHSVTLLRGQVG